MPRSRRSQVVALTRTDKKATKEQKAGIIEKVQENCDTFKYVWVFRVDNMRNKYLQEAREFWKGSKIMLGRNSVMRKALGNGPEDEHLEGTSKIGAALEGDVGLLFTNEDQTTVEEWFESFKRADFARAGNIALEGFTVPQGPIMINGDTAPHSLEPQFRKLGMPTSLVKGVPTLKNGDYVVCKKDEKLKVDQAHLLKLFFKPMATFQITPFMCLDLKEGKMLKE